MDDSRRRRILPAIAVLFFAALTVAMQEPPVLNRLKIHMEYSNGDFDQVSSGLEEFMRRNKTWSLEDSVFIAKHLAVVYTADPSTREKGRYYMHRLLELVPAAKLVDMYVGEEIDRIFEKVREEFEARRMELAGPKPRPPPVPDGGAHRDSARVSAHKSGFLLAGGAAFLVAAGAVTYYTVHPAKEAPGVKHVIPK